MGLKSLLRQNYAKVLKSLNQRLIKTLIVKSIVSLPIFHSKGKIL
jgi:hypothetical protein